jgi:hypothetical protein
MELYTYKIRIKIEFRKSFFFFKNKIITYVYLTSFRQQNFNIL